MDHGLLNYSHRIETGEGTIEIVDSFDRIDGRKLMELYAESNEENAEFFYPGLHDKREALETHPDYRRKGYGACLLDGLLNALKAQRSFQICDCVGKQNRVSLSVHEKSGFRIVSDVGYDYLANDTDDRCYGLQYTYE